ncbi:hypothetical protein KZZ08_02955 [Roseovarius mucosus]|uniref:DUF6976 family protein n=1 Tax=Roseovarius TaxID=74030 RepID=UPI001C60711D|nr:hypothetical protein [Roseovarius mucosus]MBW4972557.1 hypothetical protein [Roseovarius mucosus]
MKNEFLTPQEAAERIEAGAVMSIAGAPELLSTLPKGNWIGGSTVYFMTETGGKVDREHLFCTTFPEGSHATARYLATADLANLAQGYEAGGVTLVIIPAFSEAHARFAEDGAGYADLFDQPLLGWISGVHLDEIGKVTPSVFDGAQGAKHEDGAVLLHVSVPEGMRPSLDIVNIFKQGDDAELVFSFPEAGFSAHKAIVNGQEIGFARYVTDKGIDTKLPLVANYAGALINVSFQSVDPDAGEVAFYAPVFPGVEYRLAAAQEDYAKTFATQVGSAGEGSYSCNCILNYVYGDMEGKLTAGFTGPVTFGEIAYVLLNQTLVKLDLAA